MKIYADNHRGNYKNYKVGDTVLIKNQSSRKFDPVYKPVPYQVVQ